MQELIERVVAYYATQGRHDLPWRQPTPAGGFDPYAILVSEIMLQQTQVLRVIPKYQAFLERFPSAAMLARAPLADVLQAWSGLGYNRRAKHLWLAAQQIVSAGAFPQSIAELCALPGVGPNTAGAILAYAYNQPSTFIETNIRTVFIHHLFTDSDKVSDKQLMPYISQAVQRAAHEGLEPREWYWALMDYGTYLKQSVGNVARRSAMHSKQSAFEGSRRQVRGQVLRALAPAAVSRDQLRLIIPDDRLEAVLQDLTKEKLIYYQNGWYGLGNMIQS